MDMEIFVNKFLDLLIEENSKHNLVSRKAGRDELFSHIEDSRRLLSFLSLENKKVIDIGSGAGFPGLILAIFCPQARVTLVESDLKKSNFLVQASAELDLQNVEVVRERAEILGQDPHYRSQYDICTSRAVAAINIMLEYGIPLVKTGGSLLLWKGKNHPQEIAEAEAALKTLQARVNNIYLYSLLEEKDRAIVEVGKKGETPKQYPRRVGMPAKRPL